MCCVASASLARVTTDGKEFILRILQITACGVTDEAVHALGDLLSLITAASESENEDEMLSLVFPYLANLKNDKQKPCNSKDIFYLCGEYLPIEELENFFDKWGLEIETREVSPVEVVRFWLTTNQSDTEQGLIAALPYDTGYFDYERDELAEWLADADTDADVTAPIIPVRLLSRAEVVEFLTVHPECNTDTFDLDDNEAGWTLEEIIAEWDGVYD